MLAYSTVSQLGYMFLAVGSGAYVAAIFHMITHAFFKALLFLGSGSVIHGMHDEQDMRQMGALRKFMPITAVTFIVGWLAIAGVPPFAGFWSKDEILLFALAESPALYVVGLVTALLTAYYMTRQVIMVFFGEARWEDQRRRARRPRRRSSRTSAASCWSRSSCSPSWRSSAASSSCRSRGSPNDSKHRLEHWLEPVVEFGEADIDGTWADDNKSILLAIVAIAVRDRRHRRRLISCTSASAGQGRRADDPRRRLVLRPGRQRFMGGPGREAFEGTAWFDANVVDGAVNGTAAAVRGAAGELAQGPERLRARLRRRSSASASCCCSAGSCSCGGSSDGREPP